MINKLGYNYESILTWLLYIQLGIKQSMLTDAATIGTTPHTSFETYHAGEGGDLSFSKFLVVESFATHWDVTWHFGKLLSGILVDARKFT